MIISHSIETIKIIIIFMHPTDTCTLTEENKSFIFIPDVNIWIKLATQRTEYSSEPNNHELAVLSINTEIFHWFDYEDWKKHESWIQIELNESESAATNFKIFGLLASIEKNWCLPSNLCPFRPDQLIESQNETPLNE